MTVIHALAQVAASVAAEKMRLQSAMLGLQTDDRAGVVARLGAADTGLGALLENLSKDARTVGTGPSDMDNLITGIADDDPSDPRPHASFGDVLQSQYSLSGDDVLTPTPDQEAAASLLLTALLHAAVAASVIHESNRHSVMDLCGGPAQTLAATALDDPLPPQALAHDAPPWLEAQVYLMVAFASRHRPEDQPYLLEWAEHLAVPPGVIAQIHDGLAIPAAPEKRSAVA